MKKALFCIFTVFAVSAGLFAQQPVVAVAPFDAISGISAADANMITRVFTIRLGNTQKVAFVDRSIVDRVLQEHRFQAGDWSNAQKTAELGKALNADWIVRGELEKFGSNILVTVQFYNIQTFRFMGGGDLRIANADAAYDNMDPLVNKLIEAITNAQAATVSKIYKIGDRGPAGGFVFFENGGQYMEVSGYLGTMNWNEAVKIAGSYSVGTFNDWRLPILSEMRLLCESFEKYNLQGVLINAWYWTSTENDNSNAWVISIDDLGGRNFPDKKSKLYRVHAIRVFN